MKPKIVQITALDSTMHMMLDKLNQNTLKRGYEVHCICSNGEYIDLLSSKGYIVHPINISREINLKSNFKTIKDIYRVLKKVKPDIVHVHTPVAAVLGRVAAKLAKVENIIYTAHGFYFHEGMSDKKYKLFYNIEKYMGKLFTDYIFTQSEEDYNLAKENGFLKKSKKNNYLCISNGIDLKDRFNIERFTNTKKEQILSNYNLSKDSLILTFIGRMVKEKGILDLIEALKDLREYQDIHLFAIGGLPESERDKSLAGYIKKISNNSNVTFTGKVKNVERILYASDIFILPSYREGMPRSIIEAMAMKNAIIATNIRGSREEVIHDGNGYLVNINAPNEIKNRILELYHDSEKLDSFKNNSLKRAQKLYDEEKVVEKQIKIFEEVIS